MLEIYTVKRIDNLGRACATRRGAERSCLWPLLLAVLVGLGLFGYAWLQFRWVELGYQMERLDQRAARLEELHRALQLERAALSAPERVDLLARGQLGLQPPQAAQIIMAEPPQAGELAQARGTRSALSAR